ncbi:N-acyl homoserine lactonase family protein [bacterium]|nr:N-acyl homoserine lactonase family protein [bacterium]
MNTYTIQPLRLGTIKRKKENMSYHCGVTDVLDFPLISYYLEGAGHKIIVDTGGIAPDGEKWQPYFRNENETLDRALRGIGVLTEEIEMVILTHLHWDHASNNHLFPGARFIVQKKEHDYLKQPEPVEKKGYESDLALKTKYELIDGDQDITSGISVVLAPGHSVGMQCVVVETRAGKYILGGDLVTLLENWEASPHIPNGAFEDMDMMVESLEKIDRLHGTVLPGHDPEVFKRQRIYP